MLLQQYKIVFGGSVGAGKSAAIKMLSDVSVENIHIADLEGADTPDESKHGVSADIAYGEINLNDGTKVGLYASPDQEHFDSILPRICRDAIGVVLLINHTDPERLKSLELYLQAFEYYSENIAIGITHLDLHNSHVLKIYRDWLMQHQRQYPLFTIDARDKDDVLMLVETLIALQDVRL